MKMSELVRRHLPLLRRLLRMNNNAVLNFGSTKPHVGCRQMVMNCLGRVRRSGRAIGALCLLYRRTAVVERPGGRLRRTRLKSRRRLHVWLSNVSGVWVESRQAGRARPPYQRPPLLSSAHVDMICPCVLLLCL